MIKSKKYDWKANIEKKFEQEFDKLKYELKCPNKDPNMMLKDVYRRFEKIINLRNSDFDRKINIGHKSTHFRDLFLEPSFELSVFRDFFTFEEEFEKINKRFKCLLATGDKDRIILANLENIFDNPIVISNVDGFDPNVIFKENVNYIILYDEKISQNVRDLIMNRVGDNVNVKMKTVQRMVEQNKNFVTEKEYNDEKRAFTGSFDVSLKSIKEHGSEIRKIFNNLITVFGSIQNVLRCVNLA